MACNKRKIKSTMSTMPFIWFSLILAVITVSVWFADAKVQQRPIEKISGILILDKSDFLPFWVRFYRDIAFFVCHFRLVVLFLSRYLQYVSNFDHDVSQC